MSGGSDGKSEIEFPLNGRQRLLLAGVFLLGLVMRMVYLWGQVRNNPMFDSLIMDQLYHHTWANEIASGTYSWEHAYFRAPLYYYLLGMLYKVTGPSILAGCAAGCLMGAVTCYMIAHLGVLLAGFRAGLLAGLLAALYWPFIYFDCELLTTVLENFLNVLLLVLLLVAAQRNSLPLFLAAGIAWGLSIITRPTVLAFTPAIFIWIWLIARFRGRSLRRLPTTALIFGGAALMILPVTVRNYVVGGEFVPIATNGGVNFYIGNNPESNGISAVVPGTRQTWRGGFIDTHRIPAQELGKEVTAGEVSDYWFSRALDWIRSDPAAWGRLMLDKFFYFWYPAELPNNKPVWFFAELSGICVLFWIGFPVVGTIGMAGFFILLPVWRRWFLPMTFFVITMGTIVLFFVTGRYRLPVVPVLIVLAAGGVICLAERLRSRRYTALIPYLAGAACALGLFYYHLPQFDYFQNHTYGVGHGVLGNYYARSTPGARPDRAKAINQYREALRWEPSNAGVMCRLAWLLAASPEADLRNGEEAILLIRQAERLIEAGYTPQDTMSPLAAAYAELGNYDEAVRITREALEQAIAIGDRTIAQVQRSRLLIYQQRKPIRLSDR